MAEQDPDVLTAAQLTEDAWRYCITPLQPVAQIREGGLRIYKSGDGVRLTDYDDHVYLDMMSANTRANSLGYGNAEIAAAVAEQLQNVHYVGAVNNFAEPTIRLARRIAEKAPGDLSRVLFVSGGSEAVEAAIKIARQYQVQSGRKPGAYKIISRWNAYHGATMGAMGATDWLNIRNASGPSSPGYSFVPGPTNYRNPLGIDDLAYAEWCADQLEHQILHEGPDQVAAVIAEPVMQANGVQIAPPAYFQRVREICDRYGVLWINDEVITGFGRTGNWFAIERAGVVPDIMTFAKAMTAGYAPMGGVITTPAIIDALQTFHHIHTFSGHAGSAAAANSVITIKERDNLIDKARVDGAWFLDGLQEVLEPLSIVGQVRGVGMWLAVDFTSDKETKAPFTDDTVKAVVNRMYDYGVIASAIGTSFELAPPLITSRVDLDEVVKITERSIREIASERGFS
ncbi:MAG TPA: aminotransferase class III-fold pyridoxal phosphate-dependent enzyme [Thermomicrobiales bacterium]|nr:aminotransferase class III-fold pyridoxal phosphate-dependent enzyme [Thermomicrobiales bacterium]